jgi:hypothetical protein
MQEARMIYRLVATLVLLSAAGAALAFAVEMDFDAGGLDVLAEPYSQGPVAVVRLINGEAFPVRCRATFRNGPEASRLRQAIVPGGDSATLSWAPKRNVVRLRIEVNCERHE